MRRRQVISRRLIGPFDRLLPPGPAAASAAPSPPPDDFDVIFGSDLHTWHDPNDPAAYTLAGIGYSQLDNKGFATGIDLTQSTDIRRPRQFYLRGNSFATWHDSVQQQRMNCLIASGLTSPYTVLFIKQQFESGTLNTFARNGNGVVSQTVGTSFPKNLLFTAGTALTATGIIAEDELFSAEILVSASGAMWRSGVLVATGTTGVGQYSSGIFRGSSATPNNFDASAQGDFMVVKGAITPAQRAAVQARWAYKYNLGAGSVVHWCPIGDSITLGTGSTDGLGWRRIISDQYNRELKGGKWIVSTGSVRNYLFADDRASGVGGATIATSATLIAALFGVGNSFNCPVVFYMIGTNNMATYSPGVTVAAYDTNVRDIDTRITAALGVRPYIIVTTIIDTDPVGHATNHANTLLFNAELPAVWTAESGDGLRIVQADCYTAVGAYSAGNYDADGVHPNDTGYALIAAHLGPILYSTMALVP